MDLHLVVDVADVGVYGVRGDDELFRHGVGRVSARDEQQDLRFAGRQAELGCRFGADLLHLVSRGRRSGEGHDAELHAHERHEHDGEQAHEGQAGRRCEGLGHWHCHTLVPQRQRVARGEPQAHEAAGHGESERRGRVAFGGEDAEVHDEQHFEERLHADADDEGGEVSERRGEEQREAHHDGDEQGRVDLEDVEAVARQRVDAGDDENEQSPAQNAECEGVLAGGQHFPWDDAAEEIAGGAGEQRDEANAEHVLEAAACSAARQEYGKGALFVLAGEGQKGSRCQGEQGRRRRRYHRKAEHG